MAAIRRPPPKLGEFYDFFSFAHLTPPVHCEDPCYYADERHSVSRFVVGLCSLNLTRGVMRASFLQLSGGRRRMALLRKAVTSKSR
jgi:hypothetical protein